jgi:hypothetical protein
VQLVVETAGVADGFSVVVPPPERGGPRAAVGAALPVPPRRTLHMRTQHHTLITLAYYKQRVFT